MKGLEIVHADHLTTAVGSAGRTSNVRGHGAVALGTGLETRLAPTIRPTAHLALHLGGSSLWYGHGARRVGKGVCLLIGLQPIQ